ncbi:MAG: asparagine synthase (glutamine-hydrolyzing), partial [Planctomycetia bacterium]
MCGIAGVVWSDPDRPTAFELTEAMTRRLAHRGPDGAGVWRGRGAALGHRRLSIIDLAGGAQPLANEDETVFVTFNGEIYNFKELQPALEAAGHRFRTHCDTEVLVHAYEEYGPRGMLDRLRGMFAFAVWDAPRRRLFLARDRFGQKPLVYRCDADGLRFASELKALLVEPGFPRDVDPAALDEYLCYQYVPAPKTIFAAARKLPPGCFALYEDGRLTIERYWEPPFAVEEPRPEKVELDDLRTVLTEATRLQMMSDVPLGAFLSGGIDSTIVVGLMQKLSDRPVRTFSIA